MENRTLQTLHNELGLPQLLEIGYDIMPKKFCDTYYGESYEDIGKLMNKNKEELAKWVCELDLPMFKPSVYLILFLILSINVYILYGTELWIHSVLTLLIILFSDYTRCLRERRALINRRFMWMAMLFSTFTIAHLAKDQYVGEQNGN